MLYQLFTFPSIPSPLLSLDPYCFHIRFRYLVSWNKQTMNNSNNSNKTNSKQSSFGHTWSLGCCLNFFHSFKFLQGEMICVQYVYQSIETAFPQVASDYLYQLGVFVLSCWNNSSCFKRSVEYLAHVTEYSGVSAGLRWGLIQSLKWFIEDLDFLHVFALPSMFWLHPQAPQYHLLTFPLPSFRLSPVIAIYL